jgi:hypothetical protein
MLKGSKVESKTAIRIAKSFLKDKGIPFEEPVRASKLDGSRIEVVFAALGASDPNLVVDPPDVRVQVDTTNLVAELVPDM